MLDSQNNINKLIAMQEQQMVYINTMFNQIINESASTTASSNVQTQSGTIKESSVSSTDKQQQQQQQQQESQSINSKPITKKDQMV
jgi:hypothetical protein